MANETYLVLHNIESLISGTIAVAVAIFVIANNPRAKVNITMALINLAVAIFFFSHVIGVNIADPHLSRTVLMFNISVMYIIAFNFHCVLIVLKKDIKKRYMIYGIYGFTLILTLVYILFPDTFLLDSTAKMYFPNYYVPGDLHWVYRVTHQILIPIWMAVELYLGATRNPDAIERNRAKFFMATITVGYILGLLPLPLIYDIQINPMWGLWNVIVYSIPLVYGIITYNLTDVRIIARKAFLYGVAVASISTFLLLFNYSDRLVRELYPLFPSWIIPLLSALIAVIIGIFVWRKLRETELLKYEFITVVTHKFRTPLTHIKWAAENLSKSELSADNKTQINFIESANTKLVELTTLLMNVSDSENKSFSYQLSRNDLAEAADDISFALKEAGDSRNVSIDKDYEGQFFALFDAGRIKFVIQTFIENAVHYTRENTSITISIRKVGKEVILSVADQGIGITKEELPLLFSKFYRGKQAKLADTEGMGIGLFISKEILARHNGRIWAESRGSQKGSIFSFALPATE